MAEETKKPAKRTLRIGKYEVLAHIATGGMGAVYRALDTALGRTVALKILSAGMAEKPVMLKRFRREAQNAAQLQHENIVAIYDVGAFNGTHFLALEYVEGLVLENGKKCNDLHDYIARKGKLNPEEARQILIQAAKALDHAHRKNIVHRDIKPSNFLVTRHNAQIQVKLTDMGLSREVNDEDFRITNKGMTVGTVDYISPEQAKNSRAADIRSDIYSLGCTYYHMLSGKAPFPQGSLAERIFQHIETDAPDIRTLNAEVGEA